MARGLRCQTAMRPVGNLYPPINTIAQTATAKARASEKLNPASSLQTELGEDAQTRMRSGKDRRRNTPSHSGTDRLVPFRYSPDAPRLDAAFVAQMLGQLIPNREPGHSGALAAYEEMPEPALVFDEKL
jgi:hypothetical protein